jgi:hypothetical protein
VKEFLFLLFVGLANLFYNWWQFFVEMAHFMRFRWWWRLRFLFFLYYFPDSPFRVIRREGGLTGLKDTDLIYGETLNLTLRRILDGIGVTPFDSFVDLGCGRGMGLFFVHSLYGIPCTGYEVIPSFVRRADAIRRAMGSPGVEIINKSFLEFGRGPVESISDSGPGPEGTIFLVAGTTFDDSTLQGLAGILERSPEGAKVISISAPLAIPGFEVVKREMHYFSWGRSTVFIQRKRN